MNHMQSLILCFPPAVVQSTEKSKNLKLFVQLLFCLNYGFLLPVCCQVILICIHLCVFRTCALSQWCAIHISCRLTHYQAYDNDYDDDGGGDNDSDGGGYDNDDKEDYNI